MERKILASAISSRENFTNLEKFNISEDLSEQAKVVYSLIREYYEQDGNARGLDTDLLLSRVEREFPRQYEVFASIIKGLPDPSELSVPNLLDEIVKIRKGRIGRELSSQLLAGENDNVIDLMNQYKEVDDAIRDIEEETDTYQGLGIRELLSSVSDEKKIRLWPRSLNEATNGGALPGHNLLIFARPEMGKSLFALNMAGGFLRDGRRVLYVENEDPAEVTLARLVQRITERPMAEIRADPEGTEQLARQAGYENFILKSMSPGNFYEIQGLVDRYSPDVVIINQLRNLYVGKLSKVEQLEVAATRARNLAKKNQIVVVNVTQAGDSAFGKIFLDMGDVDFSNTGIPSQMDLMIGIGANENFEANHRRGISLCKNKLGGSHDHFPVLVDEQISKVMSL